MMPLADLKPYERNPRKNDHVVGKMKASIQEFGFKVPVLAKSDGSVIDGHLRLKAAAELQIAAVPVILCDDWTDAQVKAFRLLVNRSVNWAEWDMQLLKVELQDLEQMDFSLTKTGFDSLELDRIMALPDLAGGETGDAEAVPDVPAEPVSRPGDIWLLGKHRLMCGDSTMMADVERLMNSTRPDLVFTDPPYGIDEQTDRASRTRLAKGGTFPKIVGDRDTSTAVEALQVAIAIQAKCLIFWGANHYADALPASASWIVWDKRVDEHQRDMNSDCELAWVKGSERKSVRIFRHLWKGLIKASEHGEKRNHPTQKPIALAEWAFMEYASNSKTVLDLFIGSGSTLIACEKTQRHCYGMEISAAYIDVAVKRWQDFTGQNATLEGDGRTFDEIGQR